MFLKNIKISQQSRLDLPFGNWRQCTSCIFWPFLGTTCKKFFYSRDVSCSTSVQQILILAHSDWLFHNPSIERKCKNIADIILSIQFLYLRISSRRGRIHAQYLLPYFYFPAAPVSQFFLASWMIRV